MKASGTPTPDPGGAGSAPLPPPETEEGTDTLSGGWRALILLLAVSCVVAAVFMAGFALEAADSPDCDDRRALAAEIRDEGEDASCWNSSGLKDASVGLAWGSVAALAFAVLTALAIGATGRFVTWMLPVTGAAVVLGALAITLAAID